MAASATDKFRKGVAQWSGNIGSAGVADAVVKTVPLASTSGLPTDTAVMITVNRVDTNGKKTGNYEGIVGVVSGSNLIDCIRGVEGTAQAWTGGTVVEVLHTADNLNDLIDGILVEHGQDGKHTSAVVTTLKATGAEINTGTENGKIVTPKAIADSKLADYIRGDGWISANETWTYASASTITVPAGAAAKYAKGDKIRFKQGAGYKYFYVISIADTVLTVTGGTDYTVATPTAITDNYYSHQENPIGFPELFNYVPSWTNLTIGSATVVFKFNIKSNVLKFNMSVTFAADTTISGNVSFSIPVNYSNVSGAYSYLHKIGQGSYLDSATNIYEAIVKPTPSDFGKLNLHVLSTDASYGYNINQINATVPMTWTTNDSIDITAEYFI